MNAKEYSEILKSVLELQQRYIEEDMRNSDNNDFNAGKIAGLDIAIQKIMDSQFLCEE